MTEERPQAGPLPTKRGEIGYTEALLDQTQRATEEGSAGPDMPARHPADRDAPPPADAAQPSEDPDTLTDVPLNDSASAISHAAAEGSPSTGIPAIGSTPVADATSTRSKKSIISFLKCRKALKIGGIRFITLVRFIVQCLFIAGGIAAWAVLAKEMASHANKQQSSNSGNGGSDSSNGSNDTNPSIAAGATATIFIHVAFGVRLCRAIDLQAANIPPPLDR
jgi:hypothetical protein